MMLPDPTLIGVESNVYYLVRLRGFPGAVFGKSMRLFLP